MEQITLNSPFDAHLHLREDELLEAVLPFSAAQFCGAVVMPNLKTPLKSTNLVQKYQTNIEKALTKTAPNPAQSPIFKPFIALYLSEDVSLNELEAAKKAGIKLLKLYPKNSTTGAESGASEVLSEKMCALFEKAQDLGLILSIHGESGGFCLEREAEFGEIISQIAKTFPRLKIIFEHLSDRRSLEVLEKFSNVFGTLTLHHISLNLDDVLGGALNPHCFCKPMLKTPKDQKALLNAALNAHSKISFGSDSAPHLKSAKEKGAAGIFSAPLLLGALCELFEKHNCLENLPHFVCENAAKIYNFELPKKSVQLVKKPMKVKDEYFGIVPLFAGREISWSLTQSEIK